MDIKKDRTILIVDDDPQIVSVITKIFSKDKIDVINANNVKEALEIVNNFSIDLLIVDYLLTNGLGFEIIKQAKIDSPTLPVIMVSGAGRNIKFSSLEAGVNIYIEKPFNGRELRQIALNLLSLSETQQNLESAKDTIRALARAVETRDTYTQGHSERVSKYALSIYDEVGYDDPVERDNLVTGCLLHDIGKLGVPDNILKSDNKLSTEERIIIEKHPFDGNEICKDLKNLQGSLSIIKHHHEKLNGKGYPDGLVEDEIPEIVQIVSIADVFDALTSDRSYRTKNTPREAFEIMKEAVDKGELNKYFFDILKSLYK